MGWEGQIPPSDVENQQPSTTDLESMKKDPQYRDFVEKFIRSQAAPKTVKRSLVEAALPVVGPSAADAIFGIQPDPANPERYMRQVLGPEKTAPTVGQAMVKGIGRVARDPYGAFVESAENLSRMGGTAVQKAWALPFKNVRSATPWAQPGDVAAGEELSRVPMTVANTLVKGATAPTGVYDLATGDLDFTSAREAWQEDPFGSAAAMYGAAKVAHGIASTTRNALSAGAKLPAKVYDIVQGATTGAKPIAELPAVESVAKAMRTDYKKMMKRNPEQVQATFNRAAETIVPVEDRMAYPENLQQSVNKLNGAVDELYNQGLITEKDVNAGAGVSKTLLKATGEATTNIYHQEMSPLLKQAGPKVGLDPAKTFWENQANQWEASGFDELATQARKQASKMRTMTPEALQNRIATLNNQLDFGTLLKDDPAMAAATKQELRILNQILDEHIANTVPGMSPGQWAAIKRRYGNLLELQNGLVKNIISELRKNNKVDAADGLTRLAAAEGAGAVIMGHPKLLALAGVTEAVALFRRQLGKLDTHVSRLLRTKDAIGYGEDQRVIPTATEPRNLRGAPQAFNPETLPPSSGYIGETIPGRVGARGLEEGGQPPAALTRPRVMNPEVIEREPFSNVGERIRGAQAGPGLEEGGVPSPRLTQPRVANPEQLPPRQSSRTPEEMSPQGATNVDLRSMVSDLHNMGYTVEEIAAQIPSDMIGKTTNAQKLAFVNEIIMNITKPDLMKLLRRLTPEEVQQLMSEAATRRGR